jgi:prolyl 4-hydroxylase
MITFLLYLNDEYEGGETTFPELGIVHRGTKGNGLFFINAYPDLRPDRRMLHTGSPPVYRSARPVRATRWPLRRITTGWKDAI